MPTNWHNSDGLYVKFGNNKATSTNAGNYNLGGPYNVLEFKVTLSTLADTATILSDVVWLPDNCRVDRVQIVTETAADSAGDNAVLDVGFMAKDRSTEPHGGDDGLVAALVQASMDPAGETQEIIIGHTYVGADIGATITSGPVYITASYDTAAFTAGVIRLRVFYRQMS